MRWEQRPHPQLHYWSINSKGDTESLCCSQQMNDWEMGQLWHLLEKFYAVPQRMERMLSDGWYLSPGHSLPTIFMRLWRVMLGFFSLGIGVWAWRPLLRSLSFCSLHCIGKVLTTENLIWRWQIHLNWCSTWWWACGSSFNHCEVASDDCPSLHCIIKENFTINQLLQSQKFKFLFVEISR